jgi:hypothetical protein
MKLISCLHNTISIIAIHYKDETLSVLEVVSPQWPDLWQAKRLSNLAPFSSNIFTPQKCFLYENSLHLDKWQPPIRTKNFMDLHNGKTASTPVQCHLNVQHCSYPWPDPICHRPVNNCMAEVGVRDDCVSTLSWPPTSQTVKLMFLYSTVSTLNPVKFPQALGQCYISSAPIGQWHIAAAHLGTNKTTPTNA